MSRLLSANFARLWRSGIFRLALAANVVFGVYLDVEKYFDIKRDPDYYMALGERYLCADGIAFSGWLTLMLVAAVIIGSFVGTEYSDGTIRNKLMVGHKRSTIYLANFIVCAAASLILLIELLAVILGLGKFLFTASYMSVGEIISYTLSGCLTMIALSAILVFITMLIHNKAAGSVTVLIMVMLLLCSALHIDDRLRAPEYHSGITIVGTDAETGMPVFEKEETKNPNYLEGTKRQVYQSLYDALPACQFVQIGNENSDRIPIMAAYSLGITVVFTVGGLLLFRKKNLK